jgi:hypothetical protein
MPYSLPRLRRFRLHRLCAIALVPLCAGCYEYGPMSQAPTTGRQSVELLLNERGRADFVDRLGPDALSLEGTLVTRKDSVVTVDVTSVRYVNQAVSKWAGERLSVSNGQLRDIRNKRLSMSKTGFAIASAVGGLVAFIVTRSLTGGGDAPPPGGGLPGAQ